MEKPSLEIGNSNWAIKEGELLGYNRAGNDYLPIPITMTRASLGTRVNPEGLVEDVELLGSEEIDCGDFSCETPSTYWTEVGNSSLVVGDYQGRTNVANINILGTANSDRIKQDFTYYNGATYFISVDVYLVSGSFRVDTSNSIVPYDFISTTTTGSWQTLTGYFTAVSSSANDIWLRSTQDVSQFYISNVSVKEATIENLARVDYTDGTSSLLVEPQRTNIIPYSEDLTEWNKGNLTISPNAIISPDGTQNADTLNVIDDNDFIYEGATTTASTEYVFSFYVKRGTIAESSLKLAVYDDTNNAFIVSDISYSSSDSEWTRVTQSFTTPVGCILIRAYAFRNSSTTLGTFSVWGAQVEEGSYPTSYIPNFGTSSGVTRVQETYEKTGISNLINSEEGVLFVEMAALADDETNREITLSNGSNTNYVLIRFNNGGSNRIYTRVDVGGGIQYFNLDSNHTITDVNKIAIKWKNSDFCTFINGVKVDSQLSGSSFSANTLSELNFDNGSGLNNFFGKVKQLQVYKTALTDDELTILTGTSGVHFYTSYAAMASGLTYKIE